jgi:hypothetical protein
MFCPKFPDCFGSEECQVGGRSSAQRSSVPVKSLKVVFTKPKTSMQGDMYVTRRVQECLIVKTKRDHVIFWAKSLKRPPYYQICFTVCPGYKKCEFYAQMRLTNCKKYLHVE